CRGEYLDFASGDLRCDLFRQMGKMLVDETKQFFRLVIYSLLRGRIEAGCPGIVGMYAEPATGLAVDVHGDADLRALLRQLEAGKRYAEGGHQLGLNLLLQFFSRGSLERRHVRIRCAGNEPTLRLRLDAIHAFLDEAFDLHEGEL